GRGAGSAGARSGAKFPRHQIAKRSHAVWPLRGGPSLTAINGPRRAQADGLSGWDRQPDQRFGGAVERFEIAAAVDQPVELRLADRDPRRDRADAARLFLEIPDELAAGPFAG